MEYDQQSSPVTAGNDAKASDFNKAVADIAFLLAGGYSPYKGSAKNNGSQTIVSSSPTHVNIGTEIYDTADNLSGSVLTISQPGYYSIKGSVEMSLLNNTLMQAQLYLNGSLIRRGTSVYNASGATNTLNSDVGGDFFLEAGDTIQLFVDPGRSGQSVNGASFDWHIFSQ